MPALPPGSRVVIVGITGYIASHCGLFALRAGLLVRGTVRNLAKAEQLRAAYVKAGVDASPEKLEIVTVDDLGSERQFEAAFEGADGVVNPTLPDFDPARADYVDRVVESVITPLRVAARLGTVKRYILTSTMGAVDNMMPRTEPPGKPLAPEDFNEEAVKEYKAQKEGEPGSRFLQYVAGKTLGEQAAWQFARENKVPYEFGVVVPGLTWGPVLFGTAGSSVNMIIGLFKGQQGGLYSGHVPWFEDVRDCAKLHTLALTQPDLGGKRILAVAAPAGAQAVLDVLKKHYPDTKFPDDPAPEKGGLSKWTVDNSVGTEALGGSWISLEQAVVDTAKSFGY